MKMKFPSVLLCFSLLILMSSCQKEEDLTMTCEEGCLFTLEDTEGTMVMMNCFERYGIQIPDPDNPSSNLIYGIPDDLPEKFKEEGKKVEFSASFRANSLTPQFPDPSIDMNILYQCDLVKIEAL